MDILSSTEVRKEWSTVLDSVVRERPTVIKRTHDKVWLSNIEVMMDILDVYKFNADVFIEDDESVTLSLSEIDLVENGENLDSARLKMGAAIIEYANDYYDDFSTWNSAPNRRGHVPYIFKALLIDDAQKVGAGIICHDGKS